MTRTALRICPLCEATCGLTLTHRRRAGVSPPPAVTVTTCSAPGSSAPRAPASANSTATPTG